VFTNGYALSIIMKDESMLKIFLILCSLSNAVVGSQVSITQKADIVKALKEFNLQANLGYVLSVIGSTTDMYMLNEADIKIGLTQKYPSLDNLALSDINISELHALTYILFKHATHLSRRQRALINYFLYRTILMMALITFYIGLSGLSPNLPYPMFFTMLFTHIITPAQYFLYGISHKDYGFDSYHRIFGEYCNNQFQSVFQGTQALTTVSKALIDALLITIFVIGNLLLSQEIPIVAQTGFVVSIESLLCYNSIVLSLV
jgi:hypothetical protein